MPEARYCLLDHPQLRDVYSREELRAMLLSGRLKRSHMIVDDLTGLTHLLGDFLSWPDVRPYIPEAAPSQEAPAHAHAAAPPVPCPMPPAPAPAAPPPLYVEIRASTPLSPTPEPPEDEEEGDTCEEEEEQEWDEEEIQDPPAQEEEHEPSDTGASAPASLVPPTLDDQEYLLHHVHPSWLSYPKSLLAMAVSTAAGGYALHEEMSLAYAVTAGSLFALCLLAIWLDRIAIDYYITTRRVESETGLLGRNSHEIRHVDIRAINVQMGGLGSLFGIGTIHFSSVGSGILLEVHFKKVRNPHKLKRIVRELMNGMTEPCRDSLHA